jgi:hypothetical protein
MTFRAGILFNYPTNIALESSGTVYVAEADRNTTIMITLSENKMSFGSGFATLMIELEMPLTSILFSV